MPRYFNFFTNNEANWRDYGFTPLNYQETRSSYLFPNYTSNKPSKKRAKVKQARKVKLKNQKR